MNSNELRYPNIKVTKHILIERVSMKIFNMNKLRLFKYIYYIKIMNQMSTPAIIFLQCIHQLPITLLFNQTTFVLHKIFLLATILRIFSQDFPWNFIPTIPNQFKKSRKKQIYKPVTKRRVLTFKVYNQTIVKNTLQKYGKSKKKRKRKLIMSKKKKSKLKIMFFSKIKRKKIKVKPNNLLQSKYVPLISRIKKIMGWFLDKYLLNSKRKVPSGLTQRLYEKERESRKQKNQNQRGSKRKNDQRLDQYQELHQNKWSNKIK